MKKIFAIVFILLGCFGFAQEALNNYKYIVVPARFDFQKEVNQYQLNNLLKSKFTQLGLEAYLDTDELPQEVKTNSCLYLKPIINARSNMFTTKTIISLIDCDNKVVYTTREGVSKSKNVRVSYLEAIRSSLKSFDGFQYKYEPKKEVNNSVVISPKTPVIDVSKDPNIGNVLISDKKQKELNAYFYNGKKVKLEKDLTKLYVIEINSEKIIGTLYNSAFKKGVYHISIDGKKGIAYFIENGNLVVEFLEDEKQGTSIIIISKL